MGKSHPNVDRYVVSRVRALESLLLEKGLLPPDAVDRVIRRYEADTGPMLGARGWSRGHGWTPLTAAPPGGLAGGPGGVRPGVTTAWS